MNQAIIIPQDATKEELIAMIRDIYPLPHVGFFPLAPCWWILIAILIITGSMLFYRYKNRRIIIRNKALKELNTIFERYGIHKSPRFALGLSVILRKVAIISAGRQSVANLYGEAWIDYLSQSNIIPRDICNFISYVPYAPSEYKANLDYSNPEIIKTIKKWVIEST